ncbi:PTS glucitol/sorbitol transporter subunit IIC [Ignavigranum ruoffiae]|uniref:PTS glucitol/sorbitol transporter subunit IIC n=1 Tax=Ignavigranum ruoffiae TaxID=89093 RepID=UPI0024AD2441|nr:PTS glucitol/sorbitol transporter subunit IIC [Ignavigranum ruoffiae]
MEFIEWLGVNFIGLFEAGAEVFKGFISGIIPLLIVLLTFTNALIALIGEERVNKAIRFSSKNIILRYSVMPVLSVLLLTNPMAYTFGRFLPEYQKPAFYDSAVSFVHPVTGLFPYANGGELFVYLGIANGVIKAGYSQGSLAVRYFLAGVVVILIRGIITEKITLTIKKRRLNSVEGGN